MFFVSFAVAVITCVPSAEVELFQIKLNGDTVSEPMIAPSTVKLTDETPTLSDAETEIDTDPEIAAPFEGLVIDTVGGVTSVVEVVLTPLDVKGLGATADLNAEEMTSGTLLISFQLSSATSEGYISLLSIVLVEVVSICSFLQEKSKNDKIVVTANAEER